MGQVNFQLTHLVSRTGATGIEPAISGLTGRRVNHYTTPPMYVLLLRQRGGILAEGIGRVNMNLRFGIFDLRAEISCENLVYCPLS